MMAARLATVIAVIGTFIIASCGSSAPQAQGAEDAQSESVESADATPEETAEAEGPCSVEVDEDGDTIVANEQGGFVVALGGDNWEVDCKNPRFLMMAGSEGLVVQTMKMPRDDTDPSGEETLIGVIRGMQQAYAETGGFTPVEPTQKAVGEDSRAAKCFNGPLELNGQDVALYGCVTNGRPRRAPIS